MRADRLLALLFLCAVSVPPASATPDTAAGREEAQARVTVPRPPALTTASQSAVALVEVTNYSARRWSEPRLITVRPVWLDARGHTLDWTLPSVHLMGPLNHGEAERLCVEVTAPPEPGRYALGWRVDAPGAVLAGADQSPILSLQIVARPRAMAGPTVSPVPIGLWLLVTVGSLAAAGVVGWRLPGTAAPFEARAFGAVTAAGGVQLAGLHLALATTGLSIASASVATALLVMALWWTVSFEPAGARRVPVPAEAAADATPSARLEDGLAVAGITVLVAIVVQWWPSAAASPAIAGTDAAHYHVPNAVNFALGSGFFAPPATQHLYPMSTSVLAAWTILATGDGLLVDLAVVPAFALLAASMALLVRQLSGRAGYVWAPWLVLLLFSVPLLRWSSLMSADLPFAAAAVALAAALTSLHVRCGSARGWWVLSAIATGTLSGTKTTGVIVVALLWASLGVAWAAGRLVARRRRPAVPPPAAAAGSPQGRRPLAAATATALVLAMLTGGLWLGRNWLLFGSPLAPVSLSVAGITLFQAEGAEPPRGYLSVADDVRTVSSYNVAGRLLHFTRIWLTAWFAPALLLLVPLAVDVAATWRHQHAPARARRFVVLAWLVSSLALVALLADAPWTSLEWTRGFSLRYILPLLVMAALLSAVGALLLAERLRASGRAMAIGGLAFAATALWVFTTHATTNGVGGLASVPRLGMLPTILAAAAVAAHLAWPRRPAHRKLALLVAALAVVLVGSAAAVTTARRATRVRETRLKEVALEAGCFGAANAVRVTPDTSLRYLALAHEAETRATCRTRRFLSVHNLDFPVEFQGLPYDSRVLAIRLPGAVRYLSREAVPLGACDYLVTHESVQVTDLARQRPWAVAGGTRWEHLGRTGRYALFGVASTNESR